MPKKIFILRNMMLIEKAENYAMRNFVIYILFQLLLNSLIEEVCNMLEVDWL
jgi:hypothetical protein